MISDFTKARSVTILIVDDDDIDAKSITRALRGLKIANPIERAKDGEQALDILNKTDLEKNTYLILLDLNMPKMGGIEFLQHLRGSPALRHLMVFVLTTSDAECDIANAYYHNIAGYLVKKGGIEDFTDLLSTLKNYWRIIELP